MRASFPLLVGLLTLAAAAAGLCGGYEPGLIGVSSSAGLGAVIAFYFGLAARRW